MKRNKLITELEFDFDLFGIVSQVKEYTLAWHLNQVRHFELLKGSDLEIELSDSSVLLISNYQYETDFIKVHLLRNKLVSKGTQTNHWLLPELRQFDYLLKVENRLEEPTTADIINSVKKLEVIDYLLKLDINKIKFKENLLY